MMAGLSPLMVMVGGVLGVGNYDTMRFTSRILEGLNRQRGLVERREGIGCGAPAEEPNKVID